MDHGEGRQRELKFNTPLNIGFGDQQTLDKIYKRDNKRAVSGPWGRLIARIAQNITY
jgi:hypothetical protein